MQISSHDCENFKANTFPLGAVIHQRQYHSQQGAKNCFGKLCASTLLLPSAPCDAELGCTPLPFAPKSKYFGEMRMNGVHIAEEVRVTPSRCNVHKNCARQPFGFDRVVQNGAALAPLGCCQAPRDLRPPIRCARPYACCRIVGRVGNEPQRSAVGALQQSVPKLTTF